MATTTATHDDLTSEERTFGLAAHLSTFSGMLIPFGHIIAPLIIWLIKRDDSPFVGAHAREALNFQITITVIAMVGVAVAILTLGFGLLVVAPVLIVVSLADLILTIVAGIKAYEGRPWRYPLTLSWV